MTEQCTIAAAGLRNNVHIVASWDNAISATVLLWDLNQQHRLELAGVETPFIPCRRPRPLDLASLDEIFQIWHEVVRLTWHHLVPAVYASVCAYAVHVRG